MGKSKHMRAETTSSRPSIVEFSVQSSDLKLVELVDSDLGRDNYLSRRRVVQHQQQRIVSVRRSGKDDDDVKSEPIK